MGLSLLCRHEKKVWARRRKSSVRVPDSGHSRSGFIVFSYFEFLEYLCFRSRSPQGKRVHHHGNGEVCFKKLFNLPRARWREKLRIHPRWLAKGFIGWCLGLLACPKEYANVTGALEWKNLVCLSIIRVPDCWLTCWSAGEFGSRDEFRRYPWRKIALTVITFVNLISSMFGSHFCYSC